MPYGRKFRKSSRRYVSAKTKTVPKSARRRTRRRNYRKISVIRPKWSPAISQRKAIKFVYADSSFSRTLNVGNGYSSYYVFRGVSPYDPDYTGVGVQPYGWDQYVGAALFANFRCPASKISVYFRPEESYATMRRLHAFVIPCRDPAPVLTDISDVRMMPHRKSTTYDGLTESTRGARLTNYMSTRKFLVQAGIDTTWEGSYGANPNQGWYWLVHFYTDVFDDEEVDIYFDVKIKYYTLLSRGSQPNES